MKDAHQSKKPLLVFKYGGNAMVDDDLRVRVLRSICNAGKAGYDVVIVHGGGPFIKETLAVAKIESEFIDGHRRTTPEAYQYVEMALKGRVNSTLVGIINSLGFRAVGLSGKDGCVVTAKRRQHQRMIDGELQAVDLGHVGDVAEVDAALLHLLLAHGYIPVLTSLAADESGLGFNINADMFAGHIAAALKATQFIVLTDVDGLLADKDDAASVIRGIGISELGDLVEREIIRGGMIPKTESCRIALEGGAESARIINGTRPEQITAILDNETVGTVITRKEQAGLST